VVAWASSPASSSSVSLPVAHLEARRLYNPRARTPALRPMRPSLLNRTLRFARLDTSDFTGMLSRSVSGVVPDTASLGHDFTGLQTN
jgi:hypothetical protein